MSVNIDNYKLPDGRLDWTAYEAAKVANGESCSQCHAFIMWPKGLPCLCGSCSSLETDRGEVTHDDRIRCPHCGASTTVGPDDELYDDGEHSINCRHCDRDFDVQVHVSFSYTSPALIDDPDAEPTHG